ncbi:AraC family transcriptional regulator [bacterium]|nr:AraC family transcriptional regulator [bacterium]
MASDQIFLHALTISVIRYAQKQGMAEKEIYRILNLDLTQMDLSALQPAPEQLLQLIRQVSQETGTPFTGLQVIRFMKLSDFGIAGYVLMNCRNMAEVQEKYQTYHRLMGNVTRLTVNVAEDSVTYCWKPVKDLSAEMERIVMEYLVASIVTHSCEMTGQKLPVTAVEFSWSAPEDVSEYTRLLGSRLLFDRPHTALHFDRSYLTLPVRTANSELLSVFEGHARDLYRKLIGVGSLSEKVSMLLSERITCLPKMESLADELGMSPRNFQLNLKDEGTTYLELRDQVRYKFARDALETDSSSAAEIGLRLGFSEPSAFFRTFKRWSGKTPGAYRAAVRAANIGPGRRSKPSETPTV